MDNQLLKNPPNARYPLIPLPWSLRERAKEYELVLDYETAVLYITKPDSSGAVGDNRFINITDAIIQGIIDSGDMPLDELSITINGIEYTLSELLTKMSTDISNKPDIKATLPADKGKTMVIDQDADTNKLYLRPITSEELLDIIKEPDQYKKPVDTFDDISTTYPDPKIGDTVTALDESKDYRYKNGDDGLGWYLLFNEIKISEDPDILQIKSDITTLKDNVNTNTSDIDTLKDNVNTNTSDIGTLKNTVSNNTNNIGTLRSDVDTNTSDISSLRSDVDTNTSDIDTLKDNVSTNTSDISTLKNTVNTHTSDISTLKNTVNTHTSDISSLRSDVDTNTSDISSLRSDVDTNTSDITTLKDNVNTNTSDIDTLKDNVNTNTSDIDTLKDNVNTNTSDITTLKNTVSTNTSDIDTLKDNVSTNTTDISSLRSDVDTNITDIDTLKDNVNTNTSNISSLRSDVDTNTSNISSLRSDFDTNKVKIDNYLDQLNYKPPVDHLTDISTTYTDPKKGDTVTVLDELKSYTYNGTEWVYTQNDIYVAIDDLKEKIGDINISELIPYFPLVINNVTILQDDWILDDTILKYKYEYSNENITADSSVDFLFSLDMVDYASLYDIYPVAESEEGKAYIYSNNKPNIDITNCTIKIAKNRFE